MKAWFGTVALLALLAGCAGGGGGSRPETAGSEDAAEATTSSTGRYSMSKDAYPDLPPDVSDVPDAEPREEARAASGNRPVYEVWGKSYRVLDDPRGYRNEGTASWYGEKFHGYTTASGEIYDMYKMTAAHRSLPLPTYARVTNPDNGRSVIVKVNDRGPFHEDREIDLSYAAAARLDILGRGTGRVEVEAIDPVAWRAERQSDSSRNAEGNASVANTSAIAPQARETASSLATQTSQTASEQSEPVAPAGGANANGDRPVYLQVAALGSAAGAEALKARLESEVSQPVRVSSDANLHRVQVGPLTDNSQLEPLRDELRRAGYAQAFVVNGAQ